MKKLSILFVSLLICNSSYSQTDNLVVDDVYAKSIKKLTRNKKVKKAFNYIIDIEEKTNKNLIELTEIEAPPFKEEKRAKEFAKRLQLAGLENVWIDSIGNVIGFLKGSIGNKNIAINAHIDTVFPEGTDVRVQERNDTLYAPGIGDDTRGLAMLLTIAETIKMNNIEPVNNIIFIGTVGEEGLGDLRGVRYLFENNNPKIDSWIAIDGGSIGRVNNQALGSYRYEVVFDGPGGHSWGAFGLVNPHHALGYGIKNFIEKADLYTSSGPKTSYNVGVISGGTSINSIPFESSMLIDIRSIEPNRLDDMEEILFNSMQKALKEQNEMKRSGSDLTLTINKIGNRPSGKVEESVPLIQRTIAATQYMGVEPRLTIGSTDSNIPISIGVPAVTIGRGGEGGGAHSLDEWWINKDGYKSIQLALLILLSESEINN
ncbi:MAG: M20/M25/M40 family metallo-hydrolase [Flavobacteriaceae bacterium]|jgi:acetylornithine deacetylase/succinyl-diaminopimelate desuccinylase-like protein|nr:M20/M25/M40 family metallo-hydrolase [Flavobacteriaceae bacterium]|tara:strand:- start:712 stop:2001 length:1290 start_codon:yes stop_codon:yes gene_type:complete